MKNQDRYRHMFGLDGSDPLKAMLALEHALDIRKFEIDLYWKRAGYFWALIGVAFAGFFAVLSADGSKLIKLKGSVTNANHYQLSQIFGVR